MKTKFSKPLGDVIRETRQRTDKNGELLARQREISRTFPKAAVRSGCLICRTDLSKGNSFSHRSIHFVMCPRCGHVQTQHLPGSIYPAPSTNATFSKVYPALSDSEYESRTNRIYRPKLDWALDNAPLLGLSSEEMLSKHWLELGSGGGYFLSALAGAGAKNYVGLEADRELVSFARPRVGNNLQEYQGLPEIALELFSTDVVVAFFVFEHLGDPRSFLEGLSKLKAGTILIFSVPVFGLSCWLESAFEGFFARNLDGVLHTQLFTDESIKYLLDFAGYRKVAEWVFGQDALDLVRALKVGLGNKYSSALQETIDRSLEKIIDPVQAVIDENFLSDSRHILAVKQ